MLSLEGETVQKFLLLLLNSSLTHNHDYSSPYFPDPYPAHAPEPPSIYTHNPSPTNIFQL